MAICSNCVMDTSDTAINFDDRGFCDHCRLFLSRDQNNWDNAVNGELSHELKRTIDKIKRNKTGEFDCIIGVSGGCDSSYMLHHLVTEYGLKPLCLHVDAGWNTHEAVHNIYSLVSKLDLKLEVEVIDWIEIRELQRAFLRAHVSHQDTPQDHAFFASLHKYARRYGIRTIFSGGNLSTEAVQVPLDWIYYTSDVWQLNDIEKRFCKIKLKKYPKSSVVQRKIIAPYFYQTNVFHPLNKVKYIKRTAEKTLSEEYSFSTFREKHYESTFTKYYEGLYLPTKFGYDTRKVTYSSMILTGQMSRDEALHRLQKPALSNLEELQIEEYVADKLLMSSEELKELRLLPGKSYLDYKNQDLLYKMGSKFMKKMPGFDSSGAKR